MFIVIVFSDSRIEEDISGVIWFWFLLFFSSRCFLLVLPAAPVTIGFPLACTAVTLGPRSSQEGLFKIFIYLLFTCDCVLCVSVKSVPRCICDGQRTAFGNPFSSSTVGSGDQTHIIRSSQQAPFIHWTTWPALTNFFLFFIYFCSVIDQTPHGLD